ncbi:polysaccharide export protein [Halomonas nitroreducens]|uniref:Polysaccharide export protein Wza n=1 Tax=Halomonas nitroreducens TaxID=447425 RepID=A0A3S0HQY4_9GAMM|nr:polysaccharide export protein [Halomonas nitroreducens]RTQ98750.1 polysaccharide export protein Wza [Halomonas nitroreducens]
MVAHTEVRRSRRQSHPRLGLLALVPLILSMLVISGCAIAPGGHLEPDEAGKDLDERVVVRPITPSLVRSMSDELQQVMMARATPPDLSAAVEGYEYRIGPGDVLSIIVYDHPELTIPAGAERTPEDTGNRVRPDGTMFYPYVGRLQVAGKTLEEVRRLLTSRLSSVLTDPQVEVGVAAFRSQKVYVSGAVQAPGMVPIDIEPLTILDAISEVGGALPNADWHNVLLTRQGREERLSLFNLLRGGDLTQNRLLRDGDILHIPTSENQNVVVLGQVLRPGAIALGNERITLTDALARAGGVNERLAEPSGIFVVRGEPAESETLATVYQLDISDATRLMLGTRFPLQPQDVVYVTSAPVARWNNVISLLLPSITLPGDVATSVDDIGEL